MLVRLKIAIIHVYEAFQQAIRYFYGGSLSKAAVTINRTEGQFDII